VAMQVLATMGLTLPRHLRASDYEPFFRRAGLVEGRRPRKPGEKGRQVGFKRLAQSAVLLALSLRMRMGSRSQLNA
jgi:hypothetical protein